MTRLLAFSSILVLALSGAALAQEAGSAAGATQGMSAPMMSPARVRQAQTALKQQGLYDGRIDGIIGPETKSALTQFQKKEGLKETAELDSETYGRLASMNGESGSSMKPAAPSGSSSGGASEGQSGNPSGGSESGGGESGGTAPESGPAH